MIKHFILASALLSGVCQAEIYKCVIKGQVVYGDVPCAPGTGGKANITYSTPTPEQVQQYSSDLKRRSDNADARLQTWVENDARDKQIAQERADAYKRQQYYDAKMKRLDDIQRRLDAIEIPQRHRDPKNFYLDPRHHH
jgi:hypothetical protein